MVVSQEGQSFL